jgi:hypothetical protein
MRPGKPGRTNAADQTRTIRKSIVTCEAEDGAAGRQTYRIVVAIENTPSNYVRQAYEIALYS